MIESLFYWVGLITCFLILIGIILSVLEFIYWKIKDFKRKRKYFIRIWNKAYYYTFDEITEEKKVLK